MHPEKRIQVVNGWTRLPFTLGALFGGAALIVYFIYSAAQSSGQASEPSTFPIFAGVVCILAGAFLSAGHFTQQPNEARVLLLFGAYVGTVRDDGFHWANPFYSKRPMSLRLRNLE